MSHKKIVTLELFHQEMKFSAAHFTIFSSTERETLHGHNFQLRVEVTAEVDSNGLIFDYTKLRKHLIQLCRSLNEFCLIAEKSPYLKIRNQTASYEIIFNQQSMLLLKEDVKLLPLANISTEELATWFLEEIEKNEIIRETHSLKSLTTKISTCPGQYSSVTRSYDD